MAHTQIDWLLNNDMKVTLSGARTSTMTSTEFLNSSTGVQVDIYTGHTTGSTSILLSNLPYSTLVNSGNGGYVVVVSSTVMPTVRDLGMAIVTLAHSGADGEWRSWFVVHERGST